MFRDKTTLGYVLKYDVLIRVPNSFGSEQGSQCVLMKLGHHKRLGISSLCSNCCKSTLSHGVIRRLLFLLVVSCSFYTTRVAARVHHQMYTVS
jgi:hypothetical protein